MASSAFSEHFWGPGLPSGRVDTPEPAHPIPALDTTTIAERKIVFVEDMEGSLNFSSRGNKARIKKSAAQRGKASTYRTMWPKLRHSSRKSVNTSLSPSFFESNEDRSATTATRPV